ncbi:RHS repeat-associated core domain-containing protein [Aquipseudomonas ullengensis]|uniref:RHS domain-containing protein n=1 Tax=Aquipseudomonas ullengensis TaxID=2759166 RepID=A0A7W4QD58_9GAMM|nr:RHS repeat-associated core domain-containing protein [Pseudomonas ullengensis]MBB2494208.1 RHS domain-containing protein [Pseudomonas ullengensis]
MSFVIGSLFGSLTATQPDIKEILGDFKTCLTDYRDISEAWYGGVLDADQQFKVGDEVDTQDKDGKDPAILYATCPANGKLTLIHSFEAARFVPIGNTPVQLVPVKKGWAYDDTLGPVIHTTIGPTGIKVIDNCKPGQQYKITFFPNPTRAQVDTLFNSYQGVIGQLQGWLQTEWSTDFLPLWQTHNNANMDARVRQQMEAAWKGFLKVIMGLWDDIKSLYNLIAHPRENYEKLRKFFTEEEIKRIYNASKDALHNALLIASDEPLMWIYIAAIVAWIKMLPPQTCIEVLAELSGEVLLNILLGVVLTGGIGLAVRVGTKALKAAKGGKVLKLIEDFTAMLMNISKGHSAPHATASKPLLAHGSGAMQPARKATVEIKPATPATSATPPAKPGSGGVSKPAGRSAASAPGKPSTPATKPSGGTGQIEPDASLHTRNKPQNATSLKQVEHVDDASSPAKTPNDKPADHADKTCTNNCPVSMVTGEELLTLTDGELDGVLAFPWARLYRTSAAEIDSGLGYGWSHSLAHRLDLQGDSLVWTDHENRRTTFPVPSEQRPAITNRLSRAAIYLGEDPTELILAQAGKVPRFYHFRRDAQGGYLIAISDAYGNRLQLSRDLVGRLHRLSNNGGRALLLRYEGRRIAAVDYQVRRPSDTEEASWQTVQTLVRYRYNEAGQLLEASNALDETEHYRYDNRNVILQRQLAGGAAFFWQWQGEGKQARCVHHWANFSQMDARYTWDDKGSVTVRNADGSEETYVHDENARLVRQVDPDGAETLKAYDDKGQLIAEKNPLGAITEYRYDEAGRLETVIPAEDEPTHFSYFDGYVRTVRRGKALWKYERNDQGDITEQTDPHGHTTHYRYDTQGRLLDIRHPDGSQHCLTWNPQGQLIEERLPNGGERRYRYDAMGRQITRQDESGAITHYQWDAVGRLNQLTLPGGATRAYTYNAYSKVTGERDELGRVTRYEYADGLHLVSRRINPDGSQLRYRYDNARLLLTGIENERGEHYSLDYYPNGLIQRETAFDGRTTAYAYDLNGHLIEKKEYAEDGSERITAYQRDGDGRLLVKTLADGEQIHYAYDSLGRLVSVDDGQWPLAYGYDLQDRLIEEHQGWSTLRYEYDATGQLSHCRLPDGSRLDYRRQAGGNLVGIDLNGHPLTTHQYGVGGREQFRQQGALLSTYQYDEQGRLLAHSVRQEQRDLLQRHYRYDANGNLAGIDDSRKGSKSYHYDPLDRLVAVRGDIPESFAHDPAGTLLAQTSHHAGNLANVKGNRLLMQGDSHYDYDVYGNLVRERRGAGQKLVTEYRYDCQHRLIGASLPNGSQVQYRYDAFGRRIAKVVDGKISEFLWQGERLIAESGPAHYRSYIYEPGTFRPLVMLQGEGAAAEPFYYQLDHLGTPLELTSTAGEILWSAQYRAYGNVAKLEIADLDNPLRFQGQYFDAETGLHYNRHRYYNPSTGSFLTPDPIKLAGGLNNYRYVPNPTGWVDPLGLNNCPEVNGNSRGVTDDPLENAAANDGSPNTPTPEGENGYLYRGDTRKPEVIFEEGFRPLGVSEDLNAHVYDNKTPPSIFVSTSTDKDVGIDFGTAYRTKKGYLYILRRVDGRDVNKELGKAVPFPEEKEIAIPGGVGSKDILGVTPLNADGSYIGYSIPNPKAK